MKTYVMTSYGFPQSYNEYMQANSDTAFLIGISLPLLTVKMLNSSEILSHN
jgi:hypothetical protein